MAAFDSLVADLTAGTPPRVWSLLVTVFGDLAQKTGTHLSSGGLGQMTRLIGLKPEATRVALHRLRKDGWIDSARMGRGSQYTLTRFGRAESRAATPWIYATSGPQDPAWLVMTDPASDGSPKAKGIWLAPHILVTMTPPPLPSAFCVELSAGTDWPAWMAAKVCSPGMAAQSQALNGQLLRLEQGLPPIETLSPAEIAVLRVLIVHGWRRIILKVPALPDHLFPDTWHGAECRTRVAHLLNRLPKPNPANLDP